MHEEQRISLHAPAIFITCALKQIRSYLSLNAAKSVTLCTVASRLDYCNSLLIGTSQSNLDKLQRSHNLLARTVVNATWSVNAAEITRSLHWLPTRQRIHIKLALLAYKARHSVLPSCLDNLLLDHHLTLKLRSSSAHLLLTPAVTSTFTSRAFVVSVPAVWNSLKPDLCSVDSLGSFKSQLNNTLFLTAYGNKK